DEQTHRHASGSSGRLAFPKWNPGGDGAGSSLRGDAVLPNLFVSAWNLTTHSLLNNVESCRNLMINLATLVLKLTILQRYKVLNDDYRELYQSHRLCGDVSDRLTETQNQLVDVICNQNQLADENKTLRQEHLGCTGKEAALAKKLAVVEKEKDDLLDKSRAQEDRIKHMEKPLASKTYSLSKAESVAGTLKGDLERLTLDLSHTEIVRHNYVRHLLPTVFQRVLSSEEYKKSLFDVFNQAIAAGWSKGVKTERSVEDVEAILAAATDYDPECKATFMSGFDALFTKSYPYVEKVTESFRLHLEDLQNMKCLSFGHWHLDSSGASCIPRNVRHLAIGTWTHPEHHAFWEMFVTWPLALGLIWNVLRSEKCSSLGHWHLDSSGAFCVLENVRHLAVGTWTHPERLASGKCSSLGHWHLDSSVV
nr:hypothetical protein [Tanacetum cinerariifolium]